MLAVLGTQDLVCVLGGRHGIIHELFCWKMVVPGTGWMLWNSSRVIHSMSTANMDSQDQFDGEVGTGWYLNHISLLWTGNTLNKLGLRTSRTSLL